MRPHPLARMMANVRRYEGMWMWISGFDGRLIGTPRPYVHYTLEADEDDEYPRAMTVQICTNDGEFARYHFDNVEFLTHVRSPDPQVAGG
jgi:hypothetical protein